MLTMTPAEEPQKPAVRDEIAGMGPRSCSGCRGWLRQASSDKAVLRDTQPYPCASPGCHGLAPDTFRQLFYPSRGYALLYPNMEVMTPSVGEFNTFTDSRRFQRLITLAHMCYFMLDHVQEKGRLLLSKRILSNLLNNQVFFYFL